MNLAVKLYKDETNKPAGMPDAWPSQVRELGEGIGLPGSEWLLMTSDDYLAYMDSHEAEYASWAGQAT